jgi:hypothetical protein
VVITFLPAFSFPFCGKSREKEEKTRLEQNFAKMDLNVANEKALMKKAPLEKFFCHVWKTQRTVASDMVPVFSCINYKG